VNKSNIFVINLQQVCKCQVATSLILADLLQVVLSGSLQVDICRLDATCFINLHQVCKCQLAASLISTGLLQVGDVNA
jgi:hypothetical protein